MCEKYVQTGVLKTKGNGKTNFDYETENKNGLAARYLIVYHVGRYGVIFASPISGVHLVCDNVKK